VKSEDQSREGVSSGLSDLAAKARAAALAAQKEAALEEEKRQIENINKESLANH